MLSNGQEKNFWALSGEDVVALFETDQTRGLSSALAKERLSFFGRNVIQSSKRTNGLKIFLNQLKSPLIFVLMIAGFITLAIAHYRDATFIFFAVFINSVLGFYQENKAERALSKLKTYLKQRTKVVRDGKEQEVNAEEIVPGDLIRLSPGDRVPADARVVFVNDVQIDEAILTGESLSVSKTTETSPVSSSVSDQQSMIFAGTLVMQGECSAIVCRTKMETELGKIAALLTASSNEKTPLQAAIIRFSIVSSVVLSILTLFVFGLGVLYGYSAIEMFLVAVAIAVSAIPEGLPVSMTVILAVGVERMAKRKGVVRKLVAAEALGSTTVILTDKTGTLTMAKMELSQLIPLHTDEQTLLTRSLSNTSVLVENPEDAPEVWRMRGRIMETSLVRSAALRGMTFAEIQAKDHILQSTPFNAVQKFSVSLIREAGKYFLVFFGAPDILLRHTALEEHEKKTITQQINALAESGERVLGVAVKQMEKIEDFSLAKDLSVSELTLNGFITFRDPVRPGMKNTLHKIEQAGIRTIVLTGDHRGTAMAVAREIGLPVDDASVLDASELTRLSDEELRARLGSVSVISRVTPFDKVRIAKCLQEMGEVVAMTGDGVNDAPSIKQANVGIAMGSGTEVAQSVADLVLLDDNFETIVAAIEEGRQILGNIRKVLVYLLSNVADGLILISGSLLTGLPLPLNALQILWVNFFADSFPAMAYAFEKDPDSLLFKPQRGKMQLFDPLMKFLILVIGLSTSALLFVVYVLLMRLGFEEVVVRTFIFAAFGTYTLFLSLSVRSLEKSILSYALFSNRLLTVGIVIGFVFMIAAIYLPALQQLFGTVALSFYWVVGVFLVGLLNIVLIELAKWFFRQKYGRK